MTLLLTVIAAIVTTIVWYMNEHRDDYRLATLARIYWGASLMWLVDACFEYAELKAAYERCADDYERDDLFEENSSMIFDQMSYSGHTDCTQLIPLSYAIRGINIFITDTDIYNHFYENFNCYKNVVYSIGDAQNTLFPQFTEQISKEIQIGLGLDYLIDDFVDMRVVAIRKPDNNLRIGGEQSWQK